MGIIQPRKSAPVFEAKVSTTKLATIQEDTFILMAGNEPNFFRYDTFSTISVRLSICGSLSAALSRMF